MRSLLLLPLLLPSTHAILCDTQRVKWDNLVCNVGSLGEDSQCRYQTTELASSDGCGWFNGEECWKCCVDDTKKLVCGEFEDGYDYCLYGNLARTNSARLTCPERPPAPPSDGGDDGNEVTSKDKGGGGGGAAIAAGAGCVALVLGVAGYFVVQGFRDKGPVKGTLTYNDKKKTRGKWAVGKEDLL